MMNDNFFDTKLIPTTVGIYCHPLEVGDIVTCTTTEEALKEMRKLQEIGYYTILHSYWNGHILKSYEIKHIDKTKKPLITFEMEAETQSQEE